MAALSATAEIEHPGAMPGRVVRVDRGAATVAVLTGERRVDTRELHVTTGDWVLLLADRVATVLPRWSTLRRHGPGRAAIGQDLAANVDVVLTVIGLDQGVNTRRLERLVTLAWDSGARPVVVLNKADVAVDPDEDLAEAIDLAPAVEVVVTSALTGLGVDALRRGVGPGETAVVIGASGAGKSTLVNAMVGRPVRDTGGVRPGDVKGRHTTRARELVPLPGGGVLLDTPGIRGIGMWSPDGDDALDRAFGDVAAAAAGCRFRDCSHEVEPGCAVIAAVESGLLRADRLDAYLRLRGEIETVQRRTEVRARRRAGPRALASRRQGRR